MRNGAMLLKNKPMEETDMTMMKVGYMAPPESYSGQATVRYFSKRPVETVGFSCIVEALEALTIGEVDRAVVPVENVLGDVVDDSVDFLISYGGKKPGLQITGEILLPIEHVLAAKLPIALNQIQNVITHSQPLRQCKSFLSLHGWKCEALPGGASTAKAAEIVANQKTPETTVAITSRLAADKYGLTVIAENIGDAKDNVTRFVILGGPDTVPTGQDKTTMFLITDDKPGALCSVLTVFSVLNINLTKIDSRTAKTKLGDCIFWIDAAGHKSDELMRVALSQMPRFTKEVRVIGSYPCAKP